ncbi:hypothetical protein ASPZODRAFT_28666, partial [Penicilliopsis zonata CBS 506.65]
MLSACAPGEPKGLSWPCGSSALEFLPALFFFFPALVSLLLLLVLDPVFVPQPTVLLRSWQGCGWFLLPLFPAIRSRSQVSDRCLSLSPSVCGRKIILSSRVARVRLTRSRRTCVAFAADEPPEPRSSTATRNGFTPGDHPSSPALSPVSFLAQTHTDSRIRRSSSSTFSRSVYRHHELRSVLSYIEIGRCFLDVRRGRSMSLPDPN